MRNRYSSRIRVRILSFILTCFSGCVIFQCKKDFCLIVKASFTAGTSSQESFFFVMKRVNFAGNDVTAFRVKRSFTEFAIYVPSAHLECRRRHSLRVSADLMINRPHPPLRGTLSDRGEGQSGTALRFILSGAKRPFIAHCTLLIAH